MKLGIMQPYFFPYMGYFDLIHQSDHWIVFDTAQYIRHGWVNRNRILHPKQGWQYVIVPTQRHEQKTPINEIRIMAGGQWRTKLLGQLQHYRKQAPYFSTVVDLVATCLNNSDERLCQLNVRCLELVCGYLDIPFHWCSLSEMNLTLGPIEEPGDWAFRIAEAVGATEYINPPGGADLFDSGKFEAAGIKLTIQSPVELTYDCDGYNYERNLSIIDVMMWNSPAVVSEYLESARHPG